jgi:8-oxo-dGTP pyrophosphatase MutT (NUDIX family)
MTFDIPRNRILRIDSATLSVDPAPHPYEGAHRAAIDANWAREIAANPALFNGEVMFFSSIRWAAGILDARCHVIRFATFMHWRRHRPDTSAEHLYAHAMPVSSDGALVAIRMGRHTANAGRVYFAAGSFDPDDISEGRLDIASNMAREVAEETGLDLDAARPEDGYHGWSGEGGTVLVRRYLMDLPADAIVERIHAHIASDPAPEIEAAVVIRSADDLPHGLMAHMVPLVGWHFGLGGFPHP